VLVQLMGSFVNYYVGYSVALLGICYFVGQIPIRWAYPDSLDGYFRVCVNCT
jgi:hypothetical protein